MSKTLKTIGISALLLVIATAMAVVIYSTVSTYLEPSYEAVVEVDNASKLPYAVSNAIERVKSKGFCVVELTTSKRLSEDIYRVSCKGIDLDKLLEH